MLAPSYSFKNKSIDYQKYIYAKNCLNKRFKFQEFAEL